MSQPTNIALTRTLKQFGVPVAERLYEGKQVEYFYWVLADDAPKDHGDDTAIGDIAYYQVHYVCPWSQSYTSMKKRIRKALEAAGFTYPSVIDLSDDSERIRHLVFETEIENEYDIDEKEE